MLLEDIEWYAEPYEVLMVETWWILRVLNRNQQIPSKRIQFLIKLSEASILPSWVCYKYPGIFLLFIINAMKNFNVEFSFFINFI